MIGFVLITVDCLRSGEVLFEIQKLFSASRMKLLRVALLTAFLLMISTEFGGAQNDITVTPPTNQTIAFGSDMNVTYSCNVSDGSTAEWVFRDIQLTPGSQVVNTLRDLGIFIEGGATPRESRIIVTRAARETEFMNTDIELRCSALSQSNVFIQFGDFLYVRVFFTPNIPQNLDFNPLATNLSRLVLTWDQPDNTLIDTGDPVVTTYTVTVSGPNFNLTDTTTDTQYEIVDNPENDCAEHTFSVFASNDAGMGMPVNLNETIPISPGNTMLNSSLRVSSIELRDTVSAEVMFSPATTCDDSRFPLTRYMVTVTRGNQSYTEEYDVTDPLIAGQDPITLPVPNSALERDQDYNVTVAACISITCRESSPVSLRTTDVQSAAITFFENNVFLECTLASTVAGQGCAFRFTLSNNDTETLTVPSGATRQCDQALNMQNAYTSIVALDWNSDGTFGMVPVTVMINPEITDVANYTAITGCVPPSTGLSPGAIAGIVIGVILAVLVILAVAIVIAVVVYQQRTKKLPKIQRHDNEKFSVDFEKEWLMDDNKGAKKSNSSKVSFRRGRSHVDGDGYGSEEASIIAAGPPSLSASPSMKSQPSLTDPEPAFTLQIDQNNSRARLHLNRALIRQVLKDQRMRTLEKRRKAATSPPNESLRQLLLPLHSLIHVRGEEEGAEYRDGEVELATL